MNTDFGKRLQQLRKQQGLTQEDLAEKTGLSVQGIHFLETGRNNPRWTTVIKLCASLGISLTAFEVSNSHDTGHHPG